MKTFYTVKDNYTRAYNKSVYGSGLCVYASSEKQVINMLHKNSILDKWHFNNTSCDCCAWVDCCVIHVVEYYKTPTHILHNGNVYTMVDFAAKHPKLHDILLALVDCQ